MKGVFVQTVKLAKELGLALFREVALDGTKIEADTSKHKAMSYGRMQEEEKRLKEQIEGLLKKGQDEDEQDDQAYGAEHDGYSLPEDLSRAQERLKKIEEAKSAGTVLLEGAEVDTTRSFTEVYGSSPEPKTPVCITYHWTIFRAKASTATLTVSDRESPNQTSPPFGQEQAFNFLEIQPYHE